MADTLFEYWPQDLLDLHDDVENDGTVIAELERRKNQLNDHLSRTVEELKYRKQRLHQNTQIHIWNQPILNQEQFTIHDQALNTQIRDLEKVQKQFDEDLKTENKIEPASEGNIYSKGKTELYGQTS